MTSYVRKHLKGLIVLAVAVVLLALSGLNLSDIAGWCQEVWDQITSISWYYIVIGCTFQSAQTFLNALAWRNILAASFPREEIPVRPIFAAYAGGIGLNNVLPAQAGTIAYFGVCRAIIPHSRMTTIVAGGIPQNLFYGVIAGAIYLYLFLSRPGSFSVELDFLAENRALAAIVVVGAVVVITLVIRLLWRKLRVYWQQAVDGVAILRTPLRYVTRVLVVQVLAYLSRICVNITFMHAFGIPISARSIFLIIAANSIATTVTVTPGGVGTQQAMAAFALRNIAPASAVTAYSLGQQAVITTWNLTLGATMMATTFGWTSTRELIHTARGHAKESESPPGDEAAHEAGAEYDHD